MNNYKLILHDRKGLGNSGNFKNEMFTKLSGLWYQGLGIQKSLLSLFSDLIYHISYFTYIYDNLFSNEVVEPDIFSGQQRLRELLGFWS